MHWFLINFALFLLIIATGGRFVSGVETAESIFQKDREVIPLASCIRPFTQRIIGLGKLVRYFGNDGRLTFPNDANGREDFPEEYLHVFYRLHPRFDKEDPLSVPSASTYSFAQSLDYLTEDMRKRTTVNIFINGIENEEELDGWYNWIQYLFSNRTTFNMYLCPAGNVQSYDCMIKTALDLNLEGDAIIYFVEDDYLHLPSSTFELITIFSSHSPCLAVPYDYFDRYFMQDHNDDDGRITLFAGRNRHWRTTRSTTVTFSLRYETFLYLNHLNLLPHPLDDYGRSVALSSDEIGAFILSPLPSLATHLEDYGGYKITEPYLSLYFDWSKFGRETVNYIKTNIKENLWNFYNARSKSEL